MVLTFFIIIYFDVKYETELCGKPSFTPRVSNRGMRVCEFAGCVINNTRAISADINSVLVNN
jgi:hypothetical protein